MALNSRFAQPDEVSKAINSDNAFQVPSMPTRDGSVTGSVSSIPEFTGIPSSASTGPLNAPPTTHSDHGPYRSSRQSWTSDGIASATSAGPEEPSVVTVTVFSTSTPQPNDSSSSQDSGLSKGQTIAAIVLPIIGLLILLPIVIICIYSRRRQRRSKQHQSARELKTLSPPTTFGWLPPERRAEVGAARPAQTQLQEPGVIPGRSPTMNPGYYSGLDHSGVVATYAPPAANSEDPPPPYVPRTTAVPDPRTLTPPLTQRQLHPATLFEANLVAHGLEGPLSPFADPESDAVSEISNLERDEGRGRQRDVDELSLVSAPDHERHGEPHQIV